MKQLYMLIRTTNKETATILDVGDSDVITLLGQLYKAEHPGQTVIAPPLEGRGFSKLDKDLLQYMFWNTFQLTPPEDYAELINQALTNAQKIKPSEASVSSLRASISLYNPKTTVTADGQIVSENTKKAKTSIPKVPKSGDAKDLAKPREGSTCGLIWNIIDGLYVEGQDPKEFRKTVMEACEKEGINKSTVSVQLGKWKTHNNV